MEKQYKAIIFDLDNTLIDTKCLQEYILRIQENPVSKGKKVNLEAWDLHDQHIPYCKEFEGMRRVLDYIKDNNIECAIVSNSVKRRIKSIAEYFHIPVKESNMYGRYSTIPRVPILKPDPRVFARAIQNLKVEPREVLAIGNCYDDVIGARNAGLCSAGAIWGATDQEKEEMLQAHPDHVIESPIEIIPLLYK